MKGLPIECQTYTGIASKLLMKPLRTCLLILILLLVVIPGFSQQVKVIKMPALQKIMTRKSDTTYVINFWATWCGPCLKEMPYFEQVNFTYSKNKVKVFLVSLDAASKLEGKVKPLLLKNKIKSTVLLLDEPDQNTWIDQVDIEWSGSLPFTLVVNNNRRKRKIFEQAFTKEELETELQDFLK